MPIHYTLQQNNFKGKEQGKWYAHAVKQGELTMDDIATQIESACSMRKSDVVAVLMELRDVMERGLKAGMVVNLEEMGKFYLSIKSECVDAPKDFRVDKHVREIVCKYTPDGHRSKLRDGRIVRSFTNNCELVEQSQYSPDKHSYQQGTRGGTFRKE